MSIDYEQLKAFVKEALATDGPGGFMEPSAPEGVPHRMPAADTAPKDQEQGDPEANRLYDIALAAREATEALVEALDDPTFDAAYEHAFKASACLRRTLNSLEGTGAHPMPSQRVVAPPTNQQPYNGAGGGGVGNNFAAAIGGVDGALQEDLAGQGIPNHIQALVDRYVDLSEADQNLFDGIVAGHKGASQSPGKGLEE